MGNSPDSLDDGSPAVKPSEGNFEPEGYIPKGTAVRTKAELLQLLKDWLESSTAPTIGNVGTYGRSLCISITLESDLLARLNADTKRSAVKEYVDDALRRGSEAVWSVIPNRDGKLNKLVFREDRTATAGWYCYSHEPLPSDWKA
jgi:hypothetical protein